MNQFPIGYAFRPHLRGRLTLGRLPLPRKPRVSGGRESHPSFRVLIPAFSLPLPPATLPGVLRRSAERSPTIHHKYSRAESEASVRRLAPLHCLRTVARPVSYYALFEGMAASKPTSWLSAQPYFISHLAAFRDLSCRSGLFPSRLRTLSPAVSLPRVVFRHSEFARVWYPVKGPSPHSALPPEHLREAVPQGISGSASYFQV